MRAQQEKVGCIVTGAAGFVGSHLTERLLSLNCAVVGVDDFSSGNRKNMDTIFNHPAFTFYERSVAEPGLLAELRERHPGLHCCFHLAAVVSVPYSVAHPEETMNLNYRTTISLLEEAENLNFTKFVFAGSAAEYGDDQRLPLLEGYATEKTRHLSPYGLSKFLASRRVAASPIGAALRCFNIYGPRQNPQSPYSGVISRFIDLGIEGRPLTIFGDGHQSRDFVHVSDVVEAYLHSAGLTVPPASTVRGVYNIGIGKATTVLELAELIRELTTNNRQLSFLPVRTGDIRHSVAATEAFFRATGWAANISLQEGLSNTIHWMSTHSSRVTPTIPCSRPRLLHGTEPTR